MSFQVELKSREQILGDLIRTILANTDINDVSAGSDIATLLESIATVMYQISVGSLKILENSDLNSLVGNALDKKAESMRLPNSIGGIGRIPASQSGGLVAIGSPFEKISTKFYAGKPAPFAGARTLYLENGKGFKYKPDGSLVTNKKLYIGRGTADRYEGPIAYTDVVDQGSFWVLTLANPLTKNHLYGDSIVLAQGGDRNVQAGTKVQTSASSDTPAIIYVTTANALLKDGESTVDAPVTCTQFGEAGNALVGAIRELPTSPFAGATIFNKSAFKNGRSTESDEDLRQRIKNYPATLSRGTTAAIQAAIQGLSDPETGRAITSSVVVAPTETGEYSKVYIDDGSGLEPTFSVQPYELLLKAASGQETKFQLAQYPITPVTAIGAESAPFVLVSGEELTVIIDGVAETYSVTVSNYQNLNAASGYEIIRDFNSQSNIVGFRTMDGGKRLALIDLSGQAETMSVQVSSLQKKLGIPTSVIRPVFVYQDSKIQSFKGSTATLVTNPFASWNPNAIDLQDNLFIVDGVAQSVTITDQDFFDYSADISSATITQWSEVMAKKVAGCKFSVAGNVLICTSRQENSPIGSLEILEVKADGSPSTWVGDAKMWKPTSNGGVLFDIGAAKDYKLNRFTGEIKFINKPAAGTTIEIGTRNTRASVQALETATGLYPLAAFPDTVGNARFVVGFDGDFVPRIAAISIGDKITPTFPDAVAAKNILRITANSKFLFIKAQVGDYLYLVKNNTANPTWGSGIEGIYRIKAVGNSFSPVAVSYPSTIAQITSGTNKVIVNLPAHGMQDGARITTTVSMGFGGLTPAELSVTLAPITIINNNSFSYDALATSPSNYPASESVASGLLDDMIYDADCWIEVEISDAQSVDWTSLLGFAQDIDSGSISIFKSDNAIPQIIDMGAIGSITVDDVVDIINSQIACGVAVKLSGSAFEIRSNDWSETGSVAILSVISSASNLFSVSVDSAMQSHTGFSTSGYANGGTPVAKIVNQNNAMPTAASILIDKDLVDIKTTGAEPTVEVSPSVSEYPEGYESLWITGKQGGLTGRIYNNQVSFPFTGILRTEKSIKPLQTSDSSQTSSGSLDRYSNFSLRLQDLAISDGDKLVVEMDLDPISKTVSVPLYKKAKIQDMDVLSGSGKGQVISFRLKDPEDLYAPDPMFPTVLDGRPFFHNESVYKSFDFKDFKMLTRSVGLYREVATPAAAATGFVTSLPVDPIIGLSDGDTFTVNGVVFEFDSNGSVTIPNVAIPVNEGAKASGLITAIGMLPLVKLDESDSIVLNDGINPARTFEFDSDGLFVAGRLPISYVKGAVAAGSITAYAADPTLGVKDGDTFTIGSATFEFDTGIGVTLYDTVTFSGLTTGLIGNTISLTFNGTDDIDTVVNAWNLSNPSNVVSFSGQLGSYVPAAGVVVITNVASGNVAVAVMASWPVSSVKAALVSAINGASLSITAGSGIGDLITLTYNDYGVAGNIAVTDLASPNLGVTLYPVSLAGGVNNYTADEVATAIRTAINASGLAIVASGLNDSVVLTHTVSGTVGNHPIVVNVASGFLMPSSGMAGGTANDDAAAVKSSIITAINASSCGVTASTGSGLTILLAHQTIGVIGNIPMIESIASGASLSPVGMAGGSDLVISSNRAMIVRSAAFGATSKLRISVRLPSVPNQADLIVAHSNSFLNGATNCNLMVTLPSGATIAGSILSGGTYTVSAIQAGNLYMLTFENPSLNLTGQYQVGNVLRVGGTDVLAGGYTIVKAQVGKVSVLAPSNAGISSEPFNASKNPLSTYVISDKSYEDIATAINNYLVANPVASCVAIGTAFSTNPVKVPTYVSHSQSLYTGTSMALGLAHHSYDCKYAGSAGIWQYDSSNEAVNQIKATVQAVDSVYPTAAEASGTTYSPIGEDVIIVPSNSKTLQEWMNFNAASSLTILAETLQIKSGDNIQIASKSDGSLGAVKVTGVTGNSLTSFVIGNATSDSFSSKVKVLSTDAKAMVRQQLVRIENSLTGEIMRPYRLSPVGDEITAHNGTNINTFFRQNNSIKYVKRSLHEARLVFFRYGQGEGQAEPLSAGDQIVMSNLGSGRVQVQLTSAGELAARTGDMMYVRPTSASQSFTSPFAVDAQCKGLATVGETDGSLPEYVGYPVIRVVDSKTAIVLAPNVTTFATTTLTSSTDLVFLPAIFNEKNIRTNKAEGAKFDQTINNGDMKYIVKALGGNLVSLWVSNSSSESTDSMLLSDMSVNTDDTITLGAGFDAANQGTFKIVGHNGKNHVVMYNPIGGRDEIIDRATLQLGGKGQRSWLVGPINSASRPIRVLDAESVRIGDKVRISTPTVETAPWFPSAMYGSWRITGMGYVGFSQARGTLTPIAAEPTTGIKHLDSFTLHDGNRAVKFEFTTSGAVSNISFVAVKITTVMSVLDVATAIVNAINSLGSTFAVSSSFTGSIINLVNRKQDSTTASLMNTAIVESMDNACTLSPVGMSGAAIDDGQLTPYIDFDFTNAISDVVDPITKTPIDKFQIAGNDGAIGFSESTAFSGFRVVSGHAVNPQNAEESEVYLMPRLASTKMSDTFGTKLIAMSKIGFEQRAFQGVDGYKVYSGLVREAHRVIDGLATNPILYPGTKAMGAQIEVNPPLIKNIQLAMQVRPKDGVTINSISEIIKSTVAGYVNGLGVGKPVVISEIIRIVQGLPGVYSVAVTSTLPPVTDDRIVVSDIESVFIHNVETDITVG